ncbi:hypothetical protein HQ865_15460 [Mucilaginibacter mali]|uniref:Carbohydrate-binding domain-containing protein n=1 Tax=Mucilaginibacter mali TaxID=2740462 RepID=A0A7D4QGI4_9SPHI|nr:carbohydrate-binding family 9-like protein [Mucilaginibacter mali]QKJ31092.1 hypothetical protein HQ865_15460 [Mucilaginibacter mali]
MNRSNNLIIPFMAYKPQADTISGIGARLDNFTKQSLSHLLWLDVQPKPVVSFAIGHSRDMLFLKYYVRERDIAAVHRNINDPVYKDSCVECFIAFEHDLNYYNLEFNCAGTVLGEYGCGKTNRKFLNRQLLGLIRTETSVKFNQQDQLFEWELTIAIPTAVFEFHQIEGFGGMTCRLNFFKCGDDLPVPHYLAWNAVHATNPDFHRPEYFGTGVFERFEIPVEL